MAVEFEFNVLTKISLEENKVKRVFHTIIDCNVKHTIKKPSKRDQQ